MVYIFAINHRLYLYNLHIDINVTIGYNYYVTRGYIFLACKEPLLQFPCKAATDRVHDVRCREGAI